MKDELTNVDITGSNADIANSSGGSNGIIRTDASGNLRLVKTRSVDLELVGVVILSSGLVAALLLFIYLSFIYPTAATQLLPLIVGPVGTLVVTLIAKRQQKKNADATLNTAIKIANTSTDPGRSGSG